MEITLPKPWPEFLREVDLALEQAVNLHCLGGFILVVLYGAPRTTVDLDYISVYPPEAAAKLEIIAGERSALAKKCKVFLHSVSGTSDFPDEYQSRLQLLRLGLQHLQLWALDPYDLVLSKLSRNSPKDRDDVKFVAEALSLEFDVVYARWEKQMKPWMPRVEWHEQTLTQLWRGYFS